MVDLDITLKKLNKECNTSLGLAIASIICVVSSIPIFIINNAIGFGVALASYMLLYMSSSIFASTAFGVIKIICKDKKGCKDD